MTIHYGPQEWLHYGVKYLYVSTIICAGVCSVVEILEIVPRSIDKVTSDRVYTYA